MKASSNDVKPDSWACGGVEMAEMSDSVSITLGSSLNSAMLRVSAKEISSGVHSSIWSSTGNSDQGTMFFIRSSATLGYGDWRRLTKSRLSVGALVHLCTCI